MTFAEWKELEIGSVIFSKKEKRNYIILGFGKIIKNPYYEFCTNPRILFFIRPDKDVIEEYTFVSKYSLKNFL